MSAPENPAAFPRPSAQGWPAQDGMTLRDWFAGQALAGMLADNGVGGTCKAAAAVAYNYADAMLAAREQKA